MGSIRKGKYEDGVEHAVPYPYLSDPYEAQNEAILLEKWKQEASIMYGPFIPSGVGKLPTWPTKQLQEEVIDRLRSDILKVTISLSLCYLCSKAPT